MLFVYTKRLHHGSHEPRGSHMPHRRYDIKRLLQHVYLHMLRTNSHTSTSSIYIYCSSAEKSAVSIDYSMSISCKTIWWLGWYFSETIWNFISAPLDKTYRLPAKCVAISCVSYRGFFGVTGPFSKVASFVERRIRSGREHSAYLMWMCSIYVKERQREVDMARATALPKSIDCVHRTAFSCLYVFVLCYKNHKNASAMQRWWRCRWWRWCSEKTVAQCALKIYNHNLSH